MFRMGDKYSLAQAFAFMAVNPHNKDKIALPVAVMSWIPRPIVRWAFSFPLQRRLQAIAKVWSFSEFLE